MGNAVVPDLPYVHPDVPDDSEAPDNSGRFAGLVRGLRPRSASLGTTEYRPVAARRATRLVRRGLLTGLVVFVASAVWLALLTPATADDLSNQRKQIQRQIAQTKHDLSESSQALRTAGIAVARTQGMLDVAEEKLAETRRQLAVATARDTIAAGKLTKARQELRAAKAAVLAGQLELDAQRAMAARVVRDQYQQQNNLMPVALLVGASSPEDLQTRLQWSTTMFDTAQAEIVELTTIQRKLEAAKARQAALERKVAANRRAAAAYLKTRKALQARAAAEQVSVAALLRQRRAQQNAAADEVADDKARYTQLNKERVTVEQRIAARIAKAKAEARAKARAEARARARAALARKRAAERAAARAEAQARRAERVAKAARGAKQRARAAKAARAAKHRARLAKQRARHSSGGSRHHSSGQRSSGSFMFPVPGSITSPYGMRFHPILHYWKLHDGTDFSAGCGSVIRAAYPGRVAERYYSGAYGNRLMIDHGYVHGKFVTTGYNHAIRYIVHVGQHVRKGQVIGYVGSTGYATGCHLHLMVWLNGRMTNPMRWF
jgi:murein DD-endopeptidase MepM/ murein hydrolase activator NlpD